MAKKHNFPPAWQLPTFTIDSFSSAKPKKYCLVIPVINEGQKITTELHDLHRLKIDQLLDVIIADGGSTDGSLAPRFLRQVGVKVLLTKKGPGKLSAQLRMGYAYALMQGYQGIVTIDGNNKDDVSAIPDFVEKLDEGFDLVQGSRFISGGQAINTPLLRWWSIRLFHAPLVSVAARFWFTDTTNGFRAYSRRYLLHPQVQPFRTIFSTYELLAYLSVRAPQLHLRVTEIPVTRRYPTTGQVPTKISGWHGYWELLQSVLNCYTGRYTLPPSHV